MYNILVVSIENEKIKTEEIYFTNKHNIYDLSFKKDRVLLAKLNLNDVFFFSININATVAKFLQKLKIMDKVNPQISECYFLCDRDLKSYSGQKVKNQIIKFKKLIKEKWQNIDESKIFHLQYKEKN